MRLHTFAPPGTNFRPRLGRNDRGRDLVVAGVHGHFATLRRALAELEVDEHDRVFSIGNVVDGGPVLLDALNWMTGPGPSTRFPAALRGNHKQMMLEGPPGRNALRQLATGGDPWSRWMANGGGWWVPSSRHREAAAWITSYAGDRIDT